MDRAQNANDCARVLFTSGIRKSGNTKIVNRPWVPDGRGCGIAGIWAGVVSLTTTPTCA